MNKKLFLVILFFTANLFSQRQLPFVTYGNQAAIGEGDDDFRQIFFFKIPSDEKKNLFLKIFDAECGGANDNSYGAYDTKIRYSFYGGTGVFTSETIRSSNPTDEDVRRGNLIAQVEIGDEPQYDNDWYILSKFNIDAGESSEGYSYFKLIVEGISGNDANVFELFLSTSEYRNYAPEGSEIFAYSPTIRLPQNIKEAEIRFHVPKNAGRLSARNFDLEGGAIKFETAFRSDIKLTSSGRGVWANDFVDLEFYETGRDAAIIFGQGGEKPNDASFYLLDENTNSIPIQLPIKEKMLNTRPNIVYEFSPLSDCNSIVFDAKGSNDKDGNDLSYEWFFGDGSSAKGIRAAHSYSEQKTNSILLLVTDNSGAVANGSFKKFDAIVNRSPVANAGTDIISSPQAIIKFDASASTDSDGKIVKYIWDLGDGKIKEGKIIEHAYAVPNRYKVKLRVEDDSYSPCNYALDEVAVWINQSPISEAGIDQSVSVNQKVSFDGNGSIDVDGKIVNYFWNFGDGATAEGVKVEKVFTSAGKYTVSLKVTDDAQTANSSHTDLLVIYVNDPPVANAGKDITIAVNEVVYLDASLSRDNDGKIILYQWDLGDGQKAEGINVAHKYSQPGNYKVTLTVKDNSGTNSDLHTDEMVVTVNAKPVAVAGKDQVVTQSDLKFDGTNSKDEDGSVTQYTWDFGDGNKSNDPNPAHYYTEPGVYKVKLRVNDNTQTENSFAEDEFIVVVNEKPSGDAGPDIKGSPGQQLLFDASFSFDPDGSIEEYLWEFSDGKNFNTKIVTRDFERPGIYTARLTVRDNTQQEFAIDFDECIITINNQPVARAGADKLAAPGDMITFDASASFDHDGKIDKYLWRFSDDLFTSNTSTTKRSFDQPGIYFAYLTITDNSGTQNSLAMDTVLIRINALPISRAGNNVTTCELSISFDGSRSTDPDGNPLIYKWNFGDGKEVIGGATIVHQYAKGGTYPVILTVDDGLNLKNSSHVSSLSVTINEPPKAECGEDETVCAGEVVSFNAGKSFDPEGGLLKYSWDFGDGTTAEGINPTKIYKNGGAYQVVLKVEDDSGLPCNLDTDSKVLVVTESPVAFAGEDVKVCANTVVKFDGSKSRDYDGVVNNYFWDFGDGTSGGGATPTHAFDAPGIYRVTLTITGDVRGDCDNTDSDELIVTVYEAPVADFSAPEIFPVDQPVNFDATKSLGGGADIISYSWDFNDGTTGEGKEVQHTFKKFGNYFIKLNVKTNSQSDCNETSIQKLIVINDPPKAVAKTQLVTGKNEVIVFDGTSSSDADGSIISYKWDFGDGNFGEGPIVRYKYSNSGNFDASLTVTDNTTLNNNSSTIKIGVVVNENPVPVINAVKSACVNEVVKFDGTASKTSGGEIKNYAWDFGDGSKASGAVIEHPFRNAGVYNVTLVVDDGLNLGTSLSETSFQIKVNTLPVVKAGKDVVSCIHTEITFDAGLSFDPDGDELFFKWNFGDGNSLEGKEVKYQYSKTGNYEAVVTADDRFNTDCSMNNDKVNVLINSSPTAKIKPVEKVFVGGAHDDVLFDGTLSSDPDNDPLIYTWDFGDGETAFGAKVFHAFKQPGKYVVHLTVTDDKNTHCSLHTTSIEIIAQAR